MLKKIFADLELSENAYLVYNQLIENGASGARQIAEHLGIPRPSVYDQLKILMQKGLVVERNQENKKIFQVDDIKNLPQLVARKIETLEKDKSEFEKFLPGLLKKTDSIEPKIKFYSGVEGVKQVLNDVLWYKNIQTMSMWPISELTKVLGKDYFIALNQKRIRQNISVRALWPIGKQVTFKEHPHMGTGAGFLREIRLAPKKMSWKMGCWIYVDKVAFISSDQEMFGFVIHSRDFVELLKTQFEQIWKISKPIKSEPKYTDAFLKTI